MTPAPVAAASGLIAAGAARGKLVYGDSSSAYGSELPAPAARPSRRRLATPSIAKAPSTRPAAAASAAAVIEAQLLPEDDPNCTTTTGEVTFGLAPSNDYWELELNREEESDLHRPVPAAPAVAGPSRYAFEAPFKMVHTMHQRVYTSSWTPLPQDSPASLFAAQSARSPQLISPTASASAAGGALPYASGRSQHATYRSLGSAAPKVAAQ